MYLTGNPVSKYPGYKQKLIEVLPKIEQIDSVLIRTTINVKFSSSKTPENKTQ